MSFTVLLNVLPAVKSLMYASHAQNSIFLQTYVLPDVLSFHVLLSVLPRVESMRSQKVPFLRHKKLLARRYYQELLLLLASEASTRRYKVQVTP